MKFTRTITTGYVYKCYTSPDRVNLTFAQEITVNEMLGKREIEKLEKENGFAAVVFDRPVTEKREMSLETFIANSTVVE